MEGPWGHHAAGFEDGGRGPQAQEGGQILELQKAGRGLSGSFRKKHSSTDDTLTFAQWDPCQTYDPDNKSVF